MDELYVLARRVLLDALYALRLHRDAVIVVGAHAVYMRVGDADLAVAPHTTDGNLAIEPEALGETPPLEQAFMHAGFLPRGGDSVGVWVTKCPTSASTITEFAVDLLVPASISPGRGRRAARLPGHDARSARIVRGLEGVIADADVMRVGALDTSDVREIDVRVAGSAALLAAKLHKIRDRSGTERSIDKDALDVLRLLRGTATDDLAGRMQQLLRDDNARPVVEEALDLPGSQFANRAGEGVEMAVRAVGALGEPAEISASCEVLAGDLLRAMGR